MTCDINHTKSGIPDTNALDILVAHYLKNWKGCGQDELAWYKTSENLNEAISRATSSQTEAGRRHSHQRRIIQEAINEAQYRLIQKESELRGCISFEELHEIIKTELASVWGLGELYYYDIAHRIGAYLKHSPIKVYLHSGTRVGARALGLNVSKGYLEKRDLPKPLHRLKPDQVEDFLCLYKARLKPVS